MGRDWIKVGRDVTRFDLVRAVMPVTIATGGEGSGEMATVWRIEEDELPAGWDAAEGDVVMRRTGDEVAVGRVRGGAVTWSDERLSASLLPPGALDEVDPVGALQRPHQQKPLLTAARGIETAAADRGA